MFARCWAFFLFVALVVVRYAGVGAAESPTEEGAERAPVRTWTDSSGQYTTEAAFVGLSDGKVLLKRGSGDVIAVSMSQFSRDDQRYVREELRRRRAQRAAGNGSRRQPGAAAGDWPGWRGPNRDGKSPDTGLLKEFWANGYGKGGICLKLGADGTTASEAWTTRDMVSHHGGYIVHEGYIYGNNDSRGWSCLELTSGRTMWQERGVGKGSLCYADGMLYLFGEQDGRVGLATCSPDGLDMCGEFRVDGSGASWAHPVVSGGRLYIRYADNLYCFDVKAPGGR